MLRLHQLELSLDDAATFDPPRLRGLCAQRLHISEKAVAEARLVKRSVDARSRGGVRFSLTADVTLAQGGEAEEKRLAARFKPNQVTVISGAAAGDTPDVFGLKLAPWPAGKARPLVVGAGPAGLFCALALAVRGARPIVVERGKPVEARERDVDRLEACEHTVIPDRVVAATYLCCAAATGGDVLIKNVTPKHLEPITAKLRRAGVDVEEFDDSVRVSRKGDILPLKINTMPHPGFPTDMQPLMGVLLSVAKGTSTITESVWDNRFRYVDELRKMGAMVQVDGQVAVFEGVDKLNPAPLRASDLRAGAAMVVAALMADGTSEIEEIGHIERGYENIVEKLRGLGAEISKVERMPAALESAM